MIDYHDSLLGQTVHGNTRIQIVKELTSLFLRKHYCENDVEPMIQCFDDKFSWFGTGENEYATDPATVSEIFRGFVGMVPKCNIGEEEYHVIEISSDIYLCTGRLWITTDPSTNMYLRVHQRVTTVFRWVGNVPRCCHIHISNPYSEMTPHDVGFPAQMGQHTYEYLQKCIDEQKKQIEMQTEILQRMSFEDSLTGLFNRNKFNQSMLELDQKSLSQLGVACIDLNGLKRINDQMGHSAGDSLICKTANHIIRIFGGKGYRIGGDEFVVLDTELEEQAFQDACATIYENMSQDGISVSIGLSWRCDHCNVREQFDEADQQMYKSKAMFYNGL